MTRPSGTVTYRFRAEFRHRWKAWLGLALILGLAGGIVIALVAGARRTSSAYDRLAEANGAYDVLFISGTTSEESNLAYLCDLIAEETCTFGHLEERQAVVDSTELHVLAVVGRTPGGQQITAEDTNFVGDPSGRYGSSFNRFKVLSGRLANPAAADEVVVGFSTAERLDLSVGERFKVRLVTDEELYGVFGSGEDFAAAMSHLDQELQVVGIVASPNEFPPLEDPFVDPEHIYLTPALLEAHPDASHYSEVAVRVRGGREAAAEFFDSVQEGLASRALTAFTSDQNGRAVKRALAPLSQAMVLAAMLAAVVGVLAVGQILVRETFLESADRRTLDALGFTRREHRRLHVLKVSLIGTVGALVAGATSLALSSLFPIGLGRIAEPSPGFDADVAVVALGVVGVLVASLALGAIASITVARAGARADRSGTLTRRLMSTVRSPSARAGISMASGRSAFGTRAGVGLGLVTLVAMLGFVASADRLRHTPELYGWTWDVTLGEFGEPLEPYGVDTLVQDSEVRRLDVGAVVSAQLAGQRVRALMVEPRKGSIEPALLAGRVPEAANEILLDPTAAGDVDLGDEVSMVVGLRHVDVTVVGWAAVPDADALCSFELAERLSPDVLPHLARIELAPGVDERAFLERATRAVGLLPTNFERAHLPQDLANFARADATPLVIGGLMAMVAAATLLHALLTAIRRERRTMALLQSIGFTRGQLLATVVWFAALLVASSLLVAIPLGIAAGRWTWIAFADEIGVVASPVVSLVGVAAVATAALVLGVLASLLPGIRARRMSPAAALRVE